MNRVVIVKEKGWGSIEDEDYQAFIRMLTRLLTDTTTKPDDEPTLEVEVTASMQEALEKLGGRGTIVFISVGMLAKAKRVKAEHPSLKVVLFSGAIPDDEVILVDKTWFLDARALQRIVR